MANQAILYVLWASIHKSGGQPDVKGVSETTRSTQMSQTRPNSVTCPGVHQWRMMIPGAAIEGQGSKEASLWMLA